MQSLRAFLDVTVCIRATVGVMAVGSCLSDLEILSVSGALRDNGLLGWRTARLTSSRLNHVLFARLGALLSYPGIVLLVLARFLAAGLCLVSAVRGPVFPPILAAYVAVSLVIHLRPAMGNNGADKMLLVGAVTCLIALLAPSPFIVTIALGFLACQLSLAYAVSFILKLSQARWRNGEFLIGIFATAAFGRRRIHRGFVRWPRAAAWMSVAIIAIEFLGSLAPWAPLHFAAVFLAGVMFFHVAAAYIMGLNTFLFAFVAIFPAAIHTSLLLYR